MPIPSSLTDMMDETSNRDERARTSDVFEATLFASLAIFALSISRRRQVLARSRHGGSREGKRPNRELGRRLSAVTLDRDYLCRMPEHAQLTPMFTCNECERSYRMPRSTYEVLRETIIQGDEYFCQRYDACGVAGLTTDQKLYCALRQLSWYQIGRSCRIRACVRVYCKQLLKMLLRRRGQRFAGGILPIAKNARDIGD
jgi:hypothetical protein